VDPKIDEVKKATDRLKSNRSPGLDNITAKYGRKKLSLNGGRTDLFALPIKKETN
jgi:hypothetical protein